MSKSLKEKVEDVRKAIKPAKGKSTKKPMVFPPDQAEKPGEKTAPQQKRIGRPRGQVKDKDGKTPPEHTDEAYYTAKAQLRERDLDPQPKTVGPSDYHRGGPRLGAEELKGIVDLYTNMYGPILSLDEAAKIVKLSKQTLRRFVCEGKFASSVFRGRPLRFITQRLIEEALA